MSNKLEEFLKQLEKSTEKKQKSNKSFTPKWVNKMWLANPNEHGTIYGIGVSSTDGFPATIIEGVREVKTSKDTPWIKILPKSFYSFEEGSKEDVLYGELCSLHKSVMDDDSIHWSQRRWNNYLLMYIHILKHRNRTGKLIRENTPSLLIFDHRAATSAFQLEVANKIAMVGSSKFMDAFFNRDNEGRDKLITITYSKEDRNVTAAFNLSSISEDHFGITDNKKSIDFSSDFLDFMKDPVNDLLGVDSKEARFDYERYVNVKYDMMKMLGHEVPSSYPELEGMEKESDTTEEVSTPTPQELEVKNEEKGDLPF